MNSKKSIIELSSFFDFALTSNSLKSEKDICNHLLLTIMGHFGVSKCKIVIFKGNKEYKKGKLTENTVFYSFPLKFHNENLGELFIEHKKNLTLDDKDKKFIFSLCALSSAFLKNTNGINELKEANRSLSKKIFQINSVFEISRELLLLKNINDAISLCLNVLAGQLLVKSMCIAVKDKKGEIEYFGRNISLNDKLTDFSQIENNEKIESVIKVEENIILGLGGKFNNQKISDNDKEFASILLNFLSISIDNIFMIKDLIETEKLAKEVKIARTIQQRLLPQTLPTIKGLSMHPAMVTFGEVGGDYYDVIKLSESKLLFVIADVTGKGVPASLIMSAVQSALKTLIYHGEKDLKNIVTNINDMLCETTEGNKFVTMFIGIVDTKNMTITSINAGHNYPIILNCMENKITFLKKGGMVLGLFKGNSYIVEKTPLHNNDLIFLYTDGLTESENAFSEEFGEDNLIKCLMNYKNHVCPKISEAIIQKISEFANDKFNDDLTLLCIKIDPKDNKHIQK